jgi:hypothetical protein
MFNQDSFYKRATWERCYAWTPHTNGQNGKLMWLTYAYRGVAIWYGPGTPVVEHVWLLPADFLIATLLGKINCG